MDANELLRQQKTLAEKGKALGLTPTAPKPKAEDGGENTDDKKDKDPDNKDEDDPVAALTKRVEALEAELEDLKKKDKDTEDTNAAAFTAGTKALTDSNALLAKALEILRDPAKAQAMSAGQPAGSKAPNPEASDKHETQAAKDHDIRKQWLAMAPGAEANKFYRENAEAITRARG